MKIVLDWTLENLSSKVDGSWKLTFSTQELDGNYVGQLSDLKRNQGGFCKGLISNTNITAVEEEMVDQAQIAAVKKNKTESQRFRSVLYLVHQNLDTTTTFDEWYKMEMEKLIAHYKNKLP
jgi:hypothetical protein